MILKMAQSEITQSTKFLKEFHAEERPLDSKDVPRARHDQSFFREAGSRRRDLLRLVILWLRPARGRRVQNLYQREQRSRRSQEIRREVVCHCADRYLHRAPQFLRPGALG